MRFCSWRDPEQGSGHRAERGPHAEAGFVLKLRRSHALPRGSLGPCSGWLVDLFTSRELALWRALSSITPCPLRREFQSPVYWAQARRDLAEYDCIVQIGPGTHLRDEVAKIYRDKIVMAINTKADVEALEALVLHKTGNNEDEEHGGTE